MINLYYFNLNIINFTLKRRHFLKERHHITNPTTRRHEQDGRFNWILSQPKHFSYFLIQFFTLEALIYKLSIPFV